MKMTLDHHPPTPPPPPQTQCRQYLSCYLPDFDETLRVASWVGIKRIGVIRKRIGIGIFMIHIRFLLTGTGYFKMVFLFVSTESEYFILVFLLKENKFNILTELFV